MKLSEIWIYPVKSLPGIKLDKAKINERGFVYDRHWMLVDDSGLFMSQRRSVLMALISVSMTNDELRFTYEGCEPLCLSTRQHTSETMKVTVWEDTIDAMLVSQQADDWFSNILGMPVHLVCMSDAVTRVVDQDYATATDQTGFSDGFAFLLLGQASIDDLNHRINDESNLMDVRRFRPNLVVTGCRPYEEDDWQKVRIGEINFRVVKPCSRCVITTINPDTAEKTPEPLKTLNNYRKKGNKVFFGQNLVHDETGWLSVDDVVKVVS